jgi:1,4-dihydroxy-2-naphthoate octaprenyltransferase
LKLRSWIAAVRLKFLPQGVLPVLLGSAVAWHSLGVFNPYYFILAFIGMSLVQSALTMLNDALDYIHGTDTSSTNVKNPFSGGSGVLVDGSIKPREMLTAVAIFYLVALSIGLYLSYTIGFTLLYIILLGFFISIFYSAPPLRFAYTGLGEFAILIGYGPVITMGAYYVQTQALGVQALLAGLVPGIFMWAMIVVNEIPDYEEDKRAQKMNLVVRLGREKGRDAFALSLVAIYLLIVSFVFLGVFPFYALLALLSLPIALKAVRYLRKYYLDKGKVALANREMVKLYSSTMLLFSIGFLILR